MPTHNDLLLGQIAVRKGILSLEQLMEALQEQGKDTPPGEITVRIRRYQRPLGVILVARGYLSDAQLLVLLQEQKARLQLPADYLNLPREQVLFGQIAIREGFATPAQVHKALRIQAMVEAAPQRSADGDLEPAPEPPRLGQVMIDRGYLTPEQVMTVLRKQMKIILQCAECGCRYNIPGYEEMRQYRCRRCGGSLGPLADPADVSAEESGFLPPVAAAIPPAGAGGTRIIRKPK
jgi:hypothetical protein